MAPAMSGYTAFFATYSQVYGKKSRCFPLEIYRKHGIPPKIATSKQFESELCVHSPIITLHLSLLRKQFHLCEYVRELH
jgi:hypothetical protein